MRLEVRTRSWLCLRSRAPPPCPLCRSRKRLTRSLPCIKINCNYFSRRPPVLMVVRVCCGGRRWPRKAKSLFKYLWRVCVCVQASPRLAPLFLSISVRFWCCSLALVPRDMFTYVRTFYHQLAGPNGEPGRWSRARDAPPPSLLPARAREARCRPRWTRARRWWIERRRRPRGRRALFVCERASARVPMQQCASPTSTNANPNSNANWRAPAEWQAQERICR